LFGGGLRNLVFFLGLGSRDGGVDHLPGPHRESRAALDIGGSSARCSSNSDLPGNATPPYRWCFVLRYLFTVRWAAFLYLRISGLCVNAIVP
jgi:hypothetical protein